jgi:hypothetical protein
MIFPSRWLYGILLSLGIASGGYYGHQQWQAAKLPPKEKVLILRGLTHYSQSGWPMQELKAALEKEGYEVTIGNHTAGNDLHTLPSVVIGHSMGGNAVLKAAARLGKGPRIVVTIDPGRAPLYHSCPTFVRCVNLYDPYHPIGGQSVKGKRAENYHIRGTVHSTMPQYPKVINAVVRTVNEGKPKP